jgi:hypothetical protein
MQVSHLPNHRKLLNPLSKIDLRHASGRNPVTFPPTSISLTEASETEPLLGNLARVIRQRQL